MRAALLHSPGTPLTIESIEVSGPARCEVLVRIAVCGVCHSDLHFMEGKYRTRLPAAMGHEAAGVVEAVGADVTYVQPGDHVVTCLSTFCGRCRFCLSGRPFLCVDTSLVRSKADAPRLSKDGARVHQFADIGSYAEHVLVHENALVKISAEMPLDRAALLGCAVTTGLGAVFNTARVPVGATVAVVGCGGIGLNCVQGAKLAGASRIIAIDNSTAKLDLAERFGATDVVDVTASPMPEAVRALLPDGVEYVFEAIGLKQTVEQAFAITGRGGTTVAIGMVPEGVDLAIPGADLVMQGKQLIGSVMGSNRFRIDLPGYAELYLQGRLLLDELVSDRIELDDINDAFAAMAKGSVAREPGGLRTVTTRSVPMATAFAAIADGARVFVGSGCGTPTAIIDAMAADAAVCWSDVELVVGYLFEPLSVFAHAGAPFRFTSLQPTPLLAGLPPATWQLVPGRFSDYATMFTPSGPRPIDVAIVQVSPPGRDGRCSLGVNVGSAAAAVSAAPMVIAQVNPRMPYTFGDGELDFDAIDFAVDAEGPLPTMNPHVSTPTLAALAGHVAGQIPDGAVLHVGIGGVPVAVLDALAGHSALRLHSGTFSAGCQVLVDAGVITGTAVAAELVGDADLFAWAHRNPRLRMASAASTHQSGMLASLERFVAVNAALQVDLTGSVNAESIAGRTVSSPGGLPDVVAGALASHGGRSIIALPSHTARGHATIVDRCDAVSVPGYLADRVVTEHGVASLRGATIGERADRLRAISGEPSVRRQAEHTLGHGVALDL